MAINETKIVIKAVDEATLVFNNIKNGVTNVGSAMNGLSKDTNNLKNFMREGRAENRTFSFVMGEVRDILQTASIAMVAFGMSSKDAESTQRKMTQTVTTVMVTFQGFSTVLELTGIAINSMANLSAVAATRMKTAFGWISLLASAAAGLYFWFKKDEEAANALNNKISETPAIVGSIAFFEEQLREAQQKLNRELVVGSEEFIKQQEVVDKLAESLKNLKKGMVEIEGVVITAEDDTQRLKNTYAQFNEVMSVFSQSRQNDFNASMIRLDQEQERIKAFYNSKIEAAAGNVELEKSLEEEKNNKLASLENEKKGVQKANFEKQKEAAIVQAIIDGISAVQKVWGQTGIFGFAMAPIVAALSAANVALIASQPTPSFHKGGGMFFDAAADREMPVMVRGQETIRVTTPEQERRSGSGGVVINFNSPVSDVQFIKNSIKKVLRDTGLSVDKAFTNNRNKLSLA